MRFPDEKAPEDVHQHVRDRGRGQRHKNISLRSVYDAQIHSGVLEARKVVCPKVTDEALAAEAWRSVKNHTKSNF